MKRNWPGNEFFLCDLGLMLAMGRSILTIGGQLWSVQFNIILNHWSKNHDYVLVLNS